MHSLRGQGPRSAGGPCPRAGTPKRADLAALLDGVFDEALEGASVEVRAWAETRGWRMVGLPREPD